jgi:hypothetical protein
MVCKFKEYFRTLSGILPSIDIVRWNRGDDHQVGPRIDPYFLEENGICEEYDVFKIDALVFCLYNEKLYWGYKQVPVWYQQGSAYDFCIEWEGTVSVTKSMPKLIELVKQTNPNDLSFDKVLQALDIIVQ